MYTTLFLLIVILALLIRGFVKPTTQDKTITLVSSISLFALVWGFLGQMIGLITAFDTIEAVGDISPAVLAGGLKIAILSPLFGMIVFLIARIGIIILNILKK
jgi:biopolymer transport protein ExbB/TolQ